MTGLDVAAHREVDGFVLDANFVATPGVTTALVGPNGAGKSTIVDLLAGITRLDRGRISLGDRVFDAPADGVFVAPHLRRFGLAFQQPSLIDHLSAADNVVFALTARGQHRGSRRALRQQAIGWLERVGVSQIADQKPSTLSGGQAQRVALARALATEPDVVILDEPLSAVDIAVRTDLRRVIAEQMANHHGPRLLISHDPTDIFVLADEVVVIENGRVTQSGSPLALRRAPATQFVADFTGVNLIRGVAHHGQVNIVGTSSVLTVADTTASGPVHLRVLPNALSLHRDQPAGSPRNTWLATVTAVEDLGDIRRVHLDRPVALVADITPGAAADLELAPGSAVWVAAKATEVSVAPR